MVTTLTSVDVLVGIHQTSIDHTVHRDIGSHGGAGKRAENGDSSERFLKHISILYENSFSTGSREHALTYLKVVRPRTPLFLRSHTSARILLKRDDNVKIFFR